MHAINPKSHPNRPASKFNKTANYDSRQGEQSRLERRLNFHTKIIDHPSTRALQKSVPSPPAIVSPGFQLYLVAPTASRLFCRSRLLRQRKFKFTRLLWCERESSKNKLTTDSINGSTSVISFHQENLMFINWNLITPKIDYSERM